MLVTNDLLEAFVYCHYKAYNILNGKHAPASDYQLLYANVKRLMWIDFNRLYYPLSSGALFKNSDKEGVLSMVKFQGDTLDLEIDAVEILDKRSINIFYLSPIEKVTKQVKLLTLLQGYLIQDIIGLQVKQCKIVFGRELKQARLSISAHTRSLKQVTTELKQLLKNPTAPIFYKNPHCTACQFQASCLELLIGRDDLSLLSGLKPKEILRRYNQGIFSVKQLSYHFRPRKNSFSRRRFIPELKALAIREGKTLIQNIPTIPKSKCEIFLDIEGLPDRNLHYLIGLIVRANGEERSFSLWANNGIDEGRIFHEFLEVVRQSEEFIIYHYGAYEKRVLKKWGKTLSQPDQIVIEKILRNSFDVLGLFNENVYPPTYSNSLKDVARFLGFEWKNNDGSGLKSILWRTEWEITSSPRLKDMLLQYNLDDCKALIVVKDWVESIADSDASEMVSNLKDRSAFKWGVTDYLVKEYDEINSRAYFNYQRDHVYVRTEKKIKRALKIAKSNSKIYNKTDAKIDLVPDKCKRCKKDIIRTKTTTKKQIDIVFMKNGMRRRSMLFVGGAGYCPECGKKLSLVEIKHLPKYGPNLMLWSVNQKMQYKLSSEQVINFLKDCLRIEVSATQMTRFKEIVAQAYKQTYCEISNEIVTSDLIHVDETIARIKGIDGYVWVLANHENVYYEFHESRATGFLKEMLSSFTGVLISDFYTGYDSLECRQQKCLVHLIRDLNEDFLKHQLDDELKGIVLEFGSLLRRIVGTVDKYGLKKLHLRKHLRDVESFYKKIVSRQFESELAISYQRRLTKYRDKIFLFLNHDSVPWNNNNAEYSIKPFAKWRKKVSKSLTKQNMDNHLILLSILQTCKYRGINFFEFLRSGEKSITIYQKNLNFR